MTSNKTILLLTLALLPLASSAHTKEAEVDSLIKSAIRLREGGHLAQAADSANKALPLARAIGYRNGEVDALVEISIGLKNREAALDTINRALALAENNNYKKGEANCYVELGRYFKNVEGDYKSALANYSKAIQIRTVLKDSAGVASVYNNMSSAYLGLYQLEDAKNCSQKAVSIYTALNDQKNLIRAYNNCANVYEEIQDVDSAIYYNQKTLSAIEGFIEKDTTTWIDATYGLGKRYLEKGEHKESQKYFQVCLGLAQRTADTSAMAMAYEGLGAIEFAKEDLTRAAEHFEQAQNLYLKMHDQMGLASVLFSLGEVYRAQEEFSKAEGAYDSAKVYLGDMVLRGSTLGEDIVRNKASNDLVYKKYLQRNILGASVILALLFAVFFFFQMAKARGENIVLKENVLIEKERAVGTQQELNERNKELLDVREGAVLAAQALNEKNKEILGVREEAVLAMQKLNERDKEILNAREQAVRDREKIQRLERLHHLAVNGQLATILSYLRSGSFDLVTFTYLIEESIARLKADPSELPESMMLGKFTQSMYSKAKLFANMKEITFVREIDDAFNYQISGLVQQNLAVIVELAFSNIRNHSQCNNASLLFEVDGNSLLMKIHDDGIGFDQTKIRKGAIGVSDILAKAEEMSAVCKIDTAPGSGTTLTIRVPSPFAF
ncbi:MAG: tetratricopeptide repeat protein [Saprospiraceae bacterium]